MEFFDDILSIEDQRNILDTFTSSHFPWYLSNSELHWTAPVQYHNNNKDAFTQEGLQLVHTFVRNGELNTSPEGYAFAQTMLKMFSEKTGTKIDSIKRVKANLQPKCSDFTPDGYNTPHVDFDEPHQVLLYYVNDSDGDTFIFDRTPDGDFQVLKRIPPRQGRFVLFDGAHYHAGSHPQSHDLRIVLNIDFV
ncbi:MAG: hypothetical protein ACR2RB_22305 [Gammaproteobacteria bacterium]